MVDVGKEKRADGGLRSADAFLNLRRQCERTAASVGGQTTLARTESESNEAKTLL